MKIIVTGLFLLVFSQCVFAQGIYSENDWYYVWDAVTILDSSSTYSVLSDNTQIFSSYAWTNPDIEYGLWYSQTTWNKIFESYPVIPDTIAIDIKFVEGINLSEVRLGLALQDSFMYAWGLKQPINLNGDWQTLKFETASWFKLYLTNFHKLYLVFLPIYTDSCYIGAKIAVDNLRGIDDTLGIVMYDDFDGTSVVSPIEYNPTDFVLEQNYPNPFNPSTTINYAIPKQSFVEIKLFDLIGNEIATLVNEEQPTGTYELNWSTTSLPSGVYFYQLKAVNYTETKKMILMK